MATCKNCGRPLILNRGKCIYCDSVPNQVSQSNVGKQIGGKSKPIVQRRSVISRPKSIEELVIKVTSPQFDDIGKVLDQLRIQYIPFDGNYQCDILFLNCGTSDMIDSEQLKSFVQNGGVLYASDLTSGILLNTWPNLMEVYNSTSRCTIIAQVEDAELRQYIGNKLSVEFDLEGWSKIISALQGIVLMRSADEGFPIMMEFSIGQGKVFYTSFHNHAQTAEAEEKLLKLLVVKQVSAATKQSFQKTIGSLSVSL